MSLATFKRKTQNQYRTMSVGQAQFSINGTRRLQGYVGQNIISRSFPKTPMSGNTAKGHGGCCGTYYKAPPISPLCAGDFTNDPAVVKASVLSNAGQLESRFPEYANKIYKPDDNHHHGTSGDYTDRLSKCSRQPFCRKKPVQPCCSNPVLQRSTNYQQRSRQYPTFTKNSFFYSATTQGEYVLSLDLFVDKDKYSNQRQSNSAPFGATVQIQPNNTLLSTYYSPPNRNFFLRGINRLQKCFPGRKTRSSC